MGKTRYFALTANQSLHVASPGRALATRDLPICYRCKLRLELPWRDLVPGGRRQDWTDWTKVAIWNWGMNHGCFTRNDLRNTKKCAEQLDPFKNDTCFCVFLHVFWGLVDHPWIRFWLTLYSYSFSTNHQSVDNYSSARSIFDGFRWIQMD